ncbi:type III polyketide synthase [Synechococcus sp. AH-603-M21]|uniref:type III polyketide synthase n=1 Tax=Synechococcus sp. MVIR-18-1 TaxID=1386941 RepID=UPI0016456283|nr:type III polyketide synthase [Synechococcus sp. MVIR-18-1]MDB4336358.1 type III polyketide synthase [Synechococcus sp. AH-603-M21]
MPLMFRGLGTAVPEQSVNQTESTTLSEWVSADRPERASLVRRIQRRSQVQTRGSVLLTGDATQTIHQRLPFYGVNSPRTEERMEAYRLNASLLALKACKRALAESQLSAGVITHLITISCTGFHAPGVDCDLIDQLQLSPNVQRTHIGFMGCHAALNGLRVARAFVEADPKAVVLLCAVELCSVHLQYGWNPEHVVANTLFADGAAALVATHAETSNPKSTSGKVALQASGSTVIPKTHDLMHWQIGDHGFSMGLSPKVPEAISTSLQPWLNKWLHASGTDLNSIQHWAIHPGGPRILQACAESLSLSDDQLAHSREILSQHGNMSSATILFVLDQMRQHDCHGPCVALAFGPGLCAEVALITL